MCDSWYKLQQPSATSVGGDLSRYGHLAASFGPSSGMVTVGCLLFFSLHLRLFTSSTLFFTQIWTVEMNITNRYFRMECWYLGVSTDASKVTFLFTLLAFALLSPPKRIALLLCQESNAFGTKQLRNVNHSLAFLRKDTKSVQDMVLAVTPIFNTSLNNNLTFYF